MNPETVHVPVMPREVLQQLQLCEGLTVMDGTVGAGGHSDLILKSIGSSGRLLGFDRDPMMLAYAKQKIEQPQVTLFHASYADALPYLQQAGIDQVDRVLLDLGLSSDQLADRERGFGFDAGGPLDMRFDVSRGIPASELLQTADQQSIASLLTEFGEEPYAKQIAAAVCSLRSRQGIFTTADLEACVRTAVPGAAARSGKNPATRVFQALRIAVNNELEHVQRMLNDVLPSLLKPGGIAVVLTFHSLEDRIVKTAFKGKQKWQVLTKTPLTAAQAEIRLNPRSRSAKLRAALRLEP